MTTIDRTSGAFTDLLDLYQRASLLELGGLAHATRLALHPGDVVTYIIDRNINYTNVCVADCKFCAFYRRPKHPEGYLLSYEEIGEITGLPEGTIKSRLHRARLALKQALEETEAP